MAVADWTAEETRTLISLLIIASSCNLHSPPVCVLLPAQLYVVYPQNKCDCLNVCHFIKPVASPCNISINCNTIAHELQKYNVNVINADSMCIPRCSILMRIEWASSVNMPIDSLCPEVKLIMICRCLSTRYTLHCASFCGLVYNCKNIVLYKIVNM